MSPSNHSSATAIKSIAMIGNYLPRQCGIATFTTDLVESISTAGPDIQCRAVAMNDRPEGYSYPEKVRFVINQDNAEDYRITAEFLNINQVDVVCVQHEYGIFGGPAGSELLNFLEDLKMPVVTTLHTVLKDPLPEYREVMLRLSQLSDKLIVMSHKAVGFLKDIYGVPEQKIAFIHHGVPDIAFIDPSFYKDQFNVEAKKVLLTFGILSPNKGIETVIRALPAVIKNHADVVYIILGATHPHVVKTEGEKYRTSLQDLTGELGVREHVIFENRFVEIQELCEFLGAADIYITPYLNEAQITSGTLIYAMSAGKAIISTPYWYAEEMLADNRGRLVPFKDPGAMARQINALLDNEVERHAMRKSAYMFCRDAVWKQVAQRYLDVFHEVKRNHSFMPSSSAIQNIPPGNSFKLPEMKLDYLKILTDSTGIFQHATYTIPNLDYGYCTDDNARALIFAMMAKNHLKSKQHNPDYDYLKALIYRYISFLQHAFNAENRRFRNFMTFSRQWLEQVGSEDSHGRALWSLGKAVAYLTNPGQIAISTSLFNQALQAALQFNSSRPIAYTLLGISAYLEKFTGDNEVRRCRKILAERLLLQFNNQATKDWPWIEPVLSYGNGRIAQAILLSGKGIQCNEMIEVGIRSLSWLLVVQIENNHFVPIGCQGWYQKGGAKARFDQQPIEAHAMIDACIEAYHITGEKSWLNSAALCFSWFLGNNDCQVSLYDPVTGGCRDGLTANGANQNEGAESTLAWLLSLIRMQELHSNGTLKQSFSNTQLTSMEVR